MNKKQCNLLSKTNTIASLVLIVIGLLVFGSFLPDQRPGVLRSELTKQGYSVEHIEFEFIKEVNSEEWVFRSSEPILHDGHYTEYWQLSRRTFGIVWPNIRTEYSVEVYQPNLSQ